jgi:cellulose synthase/poly-beta-1,6-N-acetylglucosamine synthase-like glycosyltransferase
MGQRSCPGILVRLSRPHDPHPKRLTWLLLAALAGVCLNQWRLWQKDRAFLRQVRPPPPTPPLADWPQLPLVTLLVAAWNEAPQIRSFIASLASLRYPHKQLVLVAGGDDGTFTLAQAYAGPQVVVLPQWPGDGKQRALRRGFDHALGQVIYFTDADCRLDDLSFESLLWPLAAGQEQAVTGASRPFPADLRRPIILNQAAPQIYSAYHAPRYAAGLLGRNCAVTRTLLAATCALDHSAPTGTDYVLAKALLQTGARLRHQPASQVATRYPARLLPYLRQQRRWLLTLYRHGRRFSAPPDQRAALQTMHLGLLMLALPLAAPLLGPWLLTLWALLALHACLSRVRYLAFTARILSIKPTLRAYLSIPFCFLIDLLAWARPLLDFLTPHRQVPW